MSPLLLRLARFSPYLAPSRLRADEWLDYRAMTDKGIGRSASMDRAISNGR